MAEVPFAKLPLDECQWPLLKISRHGLFCYNVKTNWSVDIMSVFVAVVLFQWYHYDVIKWNHFPRYWPFVRGIHRSPVNSPHKGQWRGALIFSLICAWVNGWVNHREAGDLRRQRAHYDVIEMYVMCDFAGEHRWIYEYYRHMVKVNRHSMKKGDTDFRYKHICDYCDTCRTRLQELRE